MISLVTKELWWKKIVIYVLHEYLNHIALTLGFRISFWVYALTLVCAHIYAVEINMVALFLSPRKGWFQDPWPGTHWALLVEILILLVLPSFLLSWLNLGPWSSNTEKRLQNRKMRSAQFINLRLQSVIFLLTDIVCLPYCDIWTTLNTRIRSQFKWMCIYIYLDYLFAFLAWTFGPFLSISIWPKAQSNFSSVQKSLDLKIFVLFLMSFLKYTIQ